MRELSLIRGLEVRITWAELQDMQEERLEVWEAVMAGESHAKTAMRAEANARRK